MKSFLKTGIGSFPYKDAKAALKKILDSRIDIPFWPQLPKRDFREGMVAQFIEGMPALSIKDKSIIYNDNKREEELAIFYDKFLNKDADYFKISADFAAGLVEFINLLEAGKITSRYVKGHVTGLFTFASAIKDKNGKALLHDAMMMDAFTAGLSMKAKYQIKTFRKYAKGAVIFFDEPYLGCFGSAYTPITKDEVINRYNQILDNISSETSMIGIHCCGNTDWSLLLGLDIDIISFDAFGFSEKFLLYAKEIKDFLDRGGFIAWGIIPTSVEKSVTVKELSAILDKNFTALTKKGIDLDLINSRCLITPSCGMGALEPNRAEEVLGLLKEFGL